MRFLALFAVSLLAMIGVAKCEEVLPTLTVGATTYTNVRVLRVTGTDIYFAADNGIGNAKLTNLDATLQAKFSPYASKSASDEEASREQTVNNADYLRYEETLNPPAPPEEHRAEGEAAATNKAVAISFLNEHEPELLVDKWISASPNREGKFTLIDFWATTNEPSVSFIPTLNAFQQEFSTNLVVIGISDQSEESARTMTNIEFLSAIDPQGRMEAELDLKKLPYALLIDTNKIVRWEGNPVSSTNKLTDSVISSMIARYEEPAVPAGGPAP